jgi:uncharacterized sulfatase
MSRQIIFIMTDTQTKTMVGCYGIPEVRTPCLDQLASEGMRFENAYTCTPVCGPARSALFTGLFPHSNGSWANSMAIGDNVKTIGQRLSQKGIRAAYVGKWHLDASDYFGLAQCPDGWDPDYWYDMRNYLEELSPEDRQRSRRQRTNDENIDASFTFGHRVSNRAIDFLEKNGSDDFFLTVSYDEPHGPCLCPPPFNTMFKDFNLPKRENVKDRLEDKPEHHQLWSGDVRREDKEGLRIHHPDFFGCNSFVDSEIGRVIEAINRHAPDALVIYTSDHGDMLSSHSLRGSGKGPAMYQEITNIPFIVRWPGHTPKNSVSQALVSHVDLLPTWIEALGLTSPRWAEGRSQLPAFRNAETQVSPHIFMEFGRYETDHDGFGGFQPIRCVCNGEFKLVVNLLTSDEFYHLRNDPGEMTNLIHSSPHAVERNTLHDRLLDWMNETRDPFRGYYWRNRPWRTDAPPKSWEDTRMTRQREHEEFEPRQLDYDTGLEMEQAVRSKSGPPVSTETGKDQGLP